MTEAPAAAVLQAFRFDVHLIRSRAGDRAGQTESVESFRGSEQLGDGGFQECSGLELEADIREYLEGGRNDAVVRRVGRVKLQPLVLKRGMFLRPATAAPGATADRVIPDLWLWFQNMVRGTLPVPRFDGVIEVRGPQGTRPRATWRFVRGLPLKVVGPAMNARTGEIAIEELHVAHEGLWLEPT